MSMETTDTEYEVRGVGEIQNRIADILGYCRLDGGLHDPTEFKKKMLRRKWKCPNCNTVVGKVNYQRATELQWVIEGGDTEDVRSRASRAMEELEEVRKQKESEETEAEEEETEEAEAGEDKGVAEEEAA